MPIIRSDKEDARRTKSDGEKLILNVLRESTEIDNWIILHSLDILHNEHRTQGEADFVILAPGYGVLVLEVKDSRNIERLPSGDWKIGGEIPRRGSPFKQASESMWNVRNYLDRNGVETKGVPFFFAVWFTKELAAKFGNSIEWKKEQILGAEHLADNPVKALKSRFKALAEESRVTAYSTDDLTKIANALRPIVPLNANPIDRQKLLEKHLAAAIEQQKKLFTLFKNVRAYAVSGLAGTGKTYLAVAESQAAHLRGEPTLLVCYNSLLATDLKKKLMEFPHVKVTTIHGLMAEILGDEFKPTESVEFWSAELPKLAIEKLLNSADLPKYETLIIDEAQDLGLGEYLDFLDLMLYSGLQNSKVILYGDFANQGIYNSGEESLKLYKSRIPDLVIPDALTVNCRNTAQVGEFVADIIDLNPNYSGFLRNDPMTSVKMRGIPDGKDPKSVLIEAITAEKKLYPPNSIVVLSSQREKLKEILRSVPGNFREFREKSDSAVLYGTVQQFKGLEASSVILIEFDGGGGSTRDYFYIASTRATANFTFIVPQSILDSILQGEK